MSAPEALEPELTPFDKRVVAALEKDKGASAWQVAEAIREDDVAAVRRTLVGLVDFGYAVCIGFDNRRRWVKGWRAFR